MRISAKRNSPCSKCRKPMRIGNEIEYDPITKTAWHPACQPKPEAPGQADEQLASKLGFVGAGEAMATDWPLFLLHRTTGNGSSEPEREDDKTHRKQDSLW